MFSGQLSSVLSTDFHRLPRLAGMARAAGQSMATLSSTYPRYKTLISNRHSKEAAGILACAIPLCPLPRAKLALASLFLTRQVLLHRSASLRTMPSKRFFFFFLQSITVTSSSGPRHASIWPRRLANRMVIRRRILCSRKLLDRPYVSA
jgi:hypothetical protein